ncbi:MAG: 50S ribosomal protein L30 [Bacteroidales bacterium]|nr:50S ribosomal protein L30 [Bacteroidales bacterium]MBN2818436.1 50S ribosomal protein L30 [Bacteroidales bacterium]
MGKIKVTQIRSKIGSPKKQKATLEALGLRKINSTVEVEDSKQMRGMITAVRHLVKVEEILIS